ncbi:Macrolide export ATP-binding/permease protein MacB [Geodia barretti]|uniref:Macrolide export ATP-binding/permease protein MacB n=1 Tax=Geodia barretti TaxID=519541 RepID=A0AA35WDC6_GEOBA|nr:Macrolide export ATP-binding/permease protein MacB [Geodia barretti]
MGANKLRSGLTLLGIVIGVGAVISLMAIGQGVQQSITSNIESLGSNLIFVQPGNSSQGGGAATLTLQDAYALDDPVFAPEVMAVAPEIRASGQVPAGRNNTFAQIVGVTPEYTDVRNFPVENGSFITEGHLANNSQVAVLGQTINETLFGNRDPLGQPIRINGRQFEVIGLLKSKGSGFFGNFDNQILVPITTAYYRISSQRTTHGDIGVDSINVQMPDIDAMDSGMRQVATVLRLRHHITGEDDFIITNQRDTIETLEETTNTFVVFLAAIAGISLLVGGIGIMNIMLVSVTERTREIGIRKAMGAKRRDILLQFVSEATLLSLGGGAAGVIIGAAVARLLNGRPLLGNNPMQTAFSWDIAILALGVSAIIGLFFGIYPAVRAARLHPIEALRYE